MQTPAPFPRYISDDHDYCCSKASSNKWMWRRLVSRRCSLLCVCVHVCAGGGPLQLEREGVEVDEHFDDRPLTIKSQNCCSPWGSHGGTGS